MTGQWEHIAFYLSRGLLQRFLLARGDHHGSAFAGEGGGDRFADSAAGASYQRDPIV
jgi:hypothetical protein